MREAARFLETLSDILDVVSSEGPDSPQLELLLEAARKDIETLRMADPGARFEIGDGDVFWRGRPLAGTVDWAWRLPLREARIDTLAPPDDPAAFARWVSDLARRAGLVASSPEAEGPAEAAGAPEAPPPGAQTVTGTDAAQAVRPARRSSTVPLGEEAERIWWLYGEAANRGRVPRRETETLLDRLAHASRQGPATATGRSLDPLDELTTVHVLNVALLSMGVARHLAFDESEIRALGLGGLYHDVGRVRVAPGAAGTDPASDARRAALREHPEAGARVMMDSGSWFTVAAVVAYEHHLNWRGTGGYPELHFARPPHTYSRIVAACDVYDTLRTERSHRAALDAETAREYVRMLAGASLDPEIVTALVGYVSEPVARVEPPRARPEAGMSELKRLFDASFDADIEPRPISI